MLSCSPTLASILRDRRILLERLTSRGRSPQHLDESFQLDLLRLVLRGDLSCRLSTSIAVPLGVGMRRG